MQIARIRGINRCMQIVGACAWFKKSDVCIWMLVCIPCFCRTFYHGLGGFIFWIDETVQAQFVFISSHFFWPISNSPLLQEEFDPYYYIVSSLGAQNCRMGVIASFWIFRVKNFTFWWCLRNGSQWNEKMFFSKKKLSDIQLLLKISTFANRF